MNIRDLLVKALDKRALRKKSRETYQSKIDIFSAWLSERRIYRLKRITAKVALEFLATVSKSPTTRNTYVETLRSFFNDLKTQRLIDSNPFDGIARVPEARRGCMWFNDDQIRELSQTLPEEHPVLWMASKLLYYCFIRPTEQLSLPLEDIDLQNGVIRVHASYSKNKKTQPVVIPDEFLEDVRTWYWQQKEAGLKYFITFKGKQIPRGDWFTKQHNRIIRRLGYSHRHSFYSWKNTGAVKFYRAQRDLKALQLQLRHHSLDQVDEYLRELGVIDNPNIRAHCMTPSTLYRAA